MFMDLQNRKPTGKALVKKQLLVTNTFMLGGHDNETEEKETHYATRIMHKGQEYLNTTRKRQKNHRRIDLK